MTRLTVRPLLPRFTSATEPRYGRTEPLGITTRTIRAAVENFQVLLDSPVDWVTYDPLALR